MSEIELPIEDQHRVKKAKVWQIVGAVVLGSATLIVALLYYWSLVPINAVDIKSPITVRPSTGTKQQPFFVHLDFCSKVKGSGTVEVRFVGTYSEIISSNSDITLKKQCAQLDTPLLLPPAAPTGQYKVKYIIKIKANPVRTISQQFESESFTVK